MHDSRMPSVIVSALLLLLAACGGHERRVEHATQDSGSPMVTVSTTVEERLIQKMAEVAPIFGCKPMVRPFLSEDGTQGVLLLACEAETVSIVQDVEDTSSVSAKCGEKMGPKDCEHKLLTLVEAVEGMED